MKLIFVILLLSIFGFGCVTDDLNDVGGVFDTPSPSTAARWAIDYQDPDKCRQGLVLLSGATFGGNEVYLKLYREYVETNANPLVKSAAIAALARHGKPQDALLIAPWLKRDVSKSLNVRWTAAKGLQRLHNPDVVPALMDAILDMNEENEVRSAACIALGQYPQDRVVQALITALDAQSLSVNLDAAESLSLLTGKTFGLDITVWRTWYESANDAGTVFVGQKPYLYPTYKRNAEWWESLAFWLDEQYEQSQPPAGLRPANQRDTWQDFPSEAEGAGASGDG